MGDNFYKRILKKREPESFITKRNEQDSLEHEKIFNEAILDSVRGFLYVFDEFGRLVKWNKTFERKTGYSKEELRNMTFEKLFGTETEKLLSVAGNPFTTGFGEIETDIMMKDDKKLPVCLNGVGFKLEGKKYLTGIGIDITERKKYEEEISIAKEYFDKMFNTNPDVALITRFSDGLIFDVNEGYVTQMGYSRAETIGKKITDLGIYFDEGNRYKMVKEMTTKGRISGMEISYRQKNGSIMTGRVSSKKINIKGTEHLFSNITDITEKKITEKEIALANERYRSIFEKSPIGISVTNSVTGNFISINPRFEEICGRTKEEIIRMDWTEITHPDDIQEDLNYMRLLNDGKIKRYSIDKRYIKKDGSVVWINMTIVPIRDDNNLPCHLCMIIDISEKKEEERLLRYNSYHDYLTGVYNRRFFEEQLAMIDTNNFLPLSIVMFDINGLKLINDSFGHATGDNMLKRLIETVKKECLPGEIVARTGGDEFVILMPNVSNEKAGVRVKKLKSEISKEKIGSIFLSVSFGYETKSNENENIQEILKNAEDIMYRKKISESSSMRSNTIQLIMNTLFEKSDREMMHSKRVSEICEDIAVAMNFDKDDVNQVKTAGLMHDIGKIVIDEKILNKPAELGKNEWKDMKKHPEIGCRILKSVSEFSNLSDFILQHHERLDGTGYPKGLKAHEIPIEAKIIAVADAYDAITSERPYREGVCKEKAIIEMRKNSGTQFDPYVLEVFIENLKTSDY